MKRNIGLVVFLLLVITGCSVVQAPAPDSPSPTDWAELSRMMSSQTPVVATVTPIVWRELPLVTTTVEAYTGLIPAGWEQQPGSDLESVLFAPVGDDNFGFQVRLAGEGYDFGVLDALLNNEIQLMRQEGLAPQEVGLRRPADLTGEERSGRLADFTITLSGDTLSSDTLADEPGWLRLAVLLSDSDAAYVFRLWGPASGANQTDYGQALQRIVQAFQPAIEDIALVDDSEVEQPTASPTLEVVVATPLLTLPASVDSDVTPPPTFEVRMVTLNSEPYQSETFRLYYPDGWFPTQGVAGTTNFLDANPNALVGISVRPLGTGYNPTRDAEMLLTQYLDEVAVTSPDAVFGDQQVVENSGSGLVSGLSRTYIVPINRGHLVYRVTVLITADEAGAAFRLVQWAPYATYETQYRDLYRMVVGGFRPAAAADSTTGEDTP